MAAVSPVPRTRGGISGIMLILLGAWGAVIPFVGPYFGYAYTPDTTWAYTTGRLWLSILPGAAAFLGGVMVLLAPSRAAAMTGGFLAALAGAWFVVGVPILAVVTTAVLGVPAVSRGSVFGAPVMRLLEGLGFYYGLGVVIVFFAALALGRLAAAAYPAAGYLAPPAEAEPASPQGPYHAA